MPLLSFKFFKSSTSSRGANDDEPIPSIARNQPRNSGEHAASARSVRVSSISGNNNNSLPSSLKVRTSNESYRSGGSTADNEPSLLTTSTSPYYSSYPINTNYGLGSPLSGPVSNSPIIGNFPTAEVAMSGGNGTAGASTLANPRVSFSSTTKAVSGSGNNSAMTSGNGVGLSDQITPINSYGSYSAKSLSPAISNSNSYSCLKPMLSNSESVLLSTSPSSFSSISPAVSKEPHNYQRRVSFNTTPQEMDKLRPSTPSNLYFGNNNYDMSSAIHDSCDSDDNGGYSINPTISSGGNSGGGFMSNIMKRSDALFTSSGSKNKRKEGRSNSIYSGNRQESVSLTPTATNTSAMSNFSSRTLVNKSFSISSRHEAFEINRYSRTMIVAVNGYLDLEEFYNKTSSSSPPFQCSLESIVSANLVRDYLWSDVGFVWTIASFIEDGDELVIMKQFNTKKLKRKIQTLAESPEINCNNLLTILGERILEAAVLLARKYGRKLSIIVELASTDIYNKKGANPGNGSVSNNSSDSPGGGLGVSGNNGKKAKGHKYFWQEVFQLYLPTIVIIGRNSTTSAASVSGGGSGGNSNPADDFSNKFKFKLNPLGSNRNSKSSEDQLIDSLIRKSDMPTIMVFKNMLAGIVDLRTVNNTGGVNQSNQRDRRNSYSVPATSAGNRYRSNSGNGTVVIRTENNNPEQRIESSKVNSPVILGINYNPNNSVSGRDSSVDTSIDVSAGGNDD